MWMHLDISLIDGEGVEHILVSGFAFRVPTITNAPRRIAVKIVLTVDPASLAVRVSGVSTRLSTSVGTEAHWDAVIPEAA